MATLMDLKIRERQFVRFFVERKFKAEFRLHETVVMVDNYVK